MTKFLPYVAPTWTMCLSTKFNQSDQQLGGALPAAELVYWCKSAWQLITSNVDCCFLSTSHNNHLPSCIAGFNVGTAVTLCFLVTWFVLSSVSFSHSLLVSAAILRSSVLSSFSSFYLHYISVLKAFLSWQCRTHPKLAARHPGIDYSLTCDLILLTWNRKYRTECKKK